MSVLDFFISPAHAEAATPGAPGGFAASLPLPLIMLAIIVFMYFSIWRPQNKRAKEQNEMINAITKGDEVVTIGGIVGKVVKVTQTYLIMAVTESVEITVQKSAVSTVLPKGTMKSV